MTDSMETVCRNIIDILNALDPKKGDLMNRAEGTFLTITILAQAGAIPTSCADDMGVAIKRVCKVFGGIDAPQWPTNRFALPALSALGVERA